MEQQEKIKEITEKLEKGIEDLLPQSHLIYALSLGVAHPLFGHNQIHLPL